MRTIRLIAFSLLFAVSATAERPNVLFIAVDDLNDYVGCLGGHPDAVTPNIDRFAAENMLFTNAHTAAPVCNPSRAAFLSGVAPHRSGIYHNGDSWTLSETLEGVAHLPLHFRRQGYRTMMGGKIFHTRPDLDAAFDEDAGGFGGQAMRVFADDFPHPFKDLLGIHNFAVHWGGLEGEKEAELSDPKIAEWAVGRLSEESEEPFLLMVGFHRPHTPLTSPAEFWNRFDPGKLTLPEPEPGDLDDMPWMGRQVAIAGYQEMEGGHYRRITERGHHRDILRGYLAACAFVDAQIGKVLDALEKGPHRDDTIVVLFSDHGWGIGERYHFKKWGLWDDTTRVPLVVRAPGLTERGSTSDAGVTLLDLFPTLVDLTGVPGPDHELDGRSLRPLFENPDAGWKRPALTTFGPGNHALRGPRWRYIRWADGSEELYDHETDPHERENVADVPGNEAVKRALARWLPEGDAPSVHCNHVSPLRLGDGETLHFRSVQPGMAGEPFTIRAEIGPDIGDGVIVQHGGMFCGYALHVADGKLALSVLDVPTPLDWDTLDPHRTTVVSDRPLPTGEAIEVSAILAADGEVVLSLGGREIGRGKARTLSMHPVGQLTTGEATKDYPPAGQYKAPHQFGGALRSVVVTFGR